MNAANSDLTLKIYDDKGTEVASYSSVPKPFDIPPANAPEYWFAPPTALTKSAGVNRFVWNLRYPAPRTLPYGYFGALLGYTEYTLADHAVPGDTPRLQPQGPLVTPGKYTVELQYAGQKLQQPLTIELDPRVHASQEDLADQRDVALSASRGISASYDAFLAVAHLRRALDDQQKNANSTDLKQAADALSKQIDAVVERHQESSRLRSDQSRTGAADLQRRERRYAAGGHGADSDSAELRCPRQDPDAMAAAQRQGHSGSQFRARQ